MNKIVLLCFSLLLIAIFLTEQKTGIAEIDSSGDLALANKSPEAQIPLIKHADTTVIEMKTDGIKLGYSITEIQAKAGDILLIRYVNKSDMNHNIVLVREEADIRPVGMAALQADAVANDWIPKKEMQRIIAHSDLAYSGETIEFSFKVPPPGTYPYICTYSAHWTQMQGRLISTE
ncbi:plastocyanin/azurin family copper-binding protein [Kriegella aquimaris]|uniref:Copper binding protein, plastocyanin/azurin family n=1 Tax=Kriegella aquimaris TaxID=192904 RepID=A0A1G9VFE7_9FLAO|nr:plastocyanin/azurin family copper-binding protein [Kriegella aquimaris]SDM70826.1 Copper binding protein, plastocyanin/azurin family [Kriegella aquimaris]